MHMLPLTSWFSVSRPVTRDVHSPRSDTNLLFPPCLENRVVTREVLNVPVHM